MMRRFEPALLGLIIALALVGLTVRLLATPLLANAMFNTTGGGAASGLEPDVAIETAESELRDGNIPMAVKRVIRR